MTEVKRKVDVDGTSSMYACACVGASMYCTACTVCVSGQVGEGGACINMPRFGRTVVSLYSLGSWWCGKGVTLHPGRAALMRLSSDLIRAFLI